jgi:alpha-mannosidase
MRCGADVHDNRRQVEERVERVLRERICPAVYAATVPMDVEAWQVPDEPVPVQDALAASYKPYAVGTVWGPPWSTTWFRLHGRVPRDWAGSRVEAVIDLGFVGSWPGMQAEGLVCDLAGRPIKGIEPANSYVPVAGQCVGGEQVGFLVEAAANPDILGGGFVPTPLGDKRTAGDTPLYRLTRADLAVFDEQVWHLALDLDVLTELMHQLALTDPRRHEILRAVERALDALDLDDIPATATAARVELAPALSRPAQASAHRISAVGHAHIDSAWLWPLRETIRKTARTFVNVTALARDYPEFVFACSQAQQYAWVKRHQAEIYRRVQEAAKAGQWAPVGGMWVETDGNLPSGESLARQFAIGKRFFLEEFGVDCQGAWLPDSFGYSAAYPQLARLAGMRWFLTQKISWNQTNRFPHHTFWWEGIDGSRIFTHFPPADTYNGTLTAAELARAVANYAEKGIGTTSLLPFGHGDGGGGPTREMLERARRVADLEGSPRVVIEHPDAFFAAAEQEYPHAPVWSGELYLELHRGTFTTQARTKAGNRRAERLLREAEQWAAAASVQRGADYPYERLDRLWKSVLLHQFHDILPGTSIAWVHREAETAYTEIAAELEEIITEAVDVLAGPRGARAWVLNVAPQPRTEVVTISAGEPVPAPPGAQRLRDGGFAARADVPASGAGRFAEPDEGLPPVTVSGLVIDNGLVRVTLDECGCLASVLDLSAGREVLAVGGRGNLLQLHPDLPNQWDAWDVDRHYQHRSVDLTGAASVTVTDRGPLVAAVRVERRVGASFLAHTVRVCAGSRRVDIQTEIDWYEREKILKAAFPLDVHADRVAAEIQFGHVYRPTHTNTSWDAARFEVYGHRWLHIGEPGYGVALITDSTYGHDVGRSTRDDGGTTTTVRLSLLRAPRSPDPDADQGPHRFCYALLPGATLADAVAHGYALSLPLRVVRGGAGALPAPLLAIDGGGVTVESIKLSEDRSGAVVVRLYEALGGRASAVLRPGFVVAGVEVVDLLERPLPEAAPLLGPDGTIAVTLRPFQILTLRLRRDTG